MTLIIGLTGSIGMGKTTTAQMFREFDIPVFDADAAVHDLYKKDAVDRIEDNFPGTKTKDGIDRKKLASYVIGHPDQLKKLEAIIHPLVQEKRSHFIKHHQERATPLIILDVPLLFETGTDNLCDKIVVVTADAAIQKKRVLERNTMSEEQLNEILKKQIPDQEKRARADHVIETNFGLNHARQQVENIVKLYRSHGNEHA